MKGLLRWLKRPLPIMQAVTVSFIVGELVFLILIFIWGLIKR